MLPFAGQFYATAAKRQEQNTQYSVWSNSGIPASFNSVAQPKHRRILGEAIRNYRKRAGLTQEQLAEKADLHHNFIGGIERGVMETSLTSLTKIAKALRVRVRDLVSEI
jgi:DNA-binding XRE family transcriptional regulator